MPDKINVFVACNFNLHCTEGETWRLSTFDEQRVVIKIDKCIPGPIHRRKKTVFWLYEPRAMVPKIYHSFELGRARNILVVTHDPNLKVENKLVIGPHFNAHLKEQDWQIYPKTKNVSMIASTKRWCSGHVYRQTIADRLKGVADLFGRGRNPIADKIEGLKDYRFSVQMENSIADVYYTEKILDCFLSGTIPIYWGTERINDRFDKRGIIMLDDYLKNIDNFDYVSEYESRKEQILYNFNEARNVQNPKQAIDKIIGYLLENQLISRGVN